MEVIEAYQIHSTIIISSILITLRSFLVVSLFVVAVSILAVILLLLHLNMAKKRWYASHAMEEWDPPINDFVFRYNSCWWTNKNVEIIRTSHECMIYAIAKTDTTALINVKSFAKIAIKLSVAVNLYDNLIMWMPCFHLTRYIRK